MMDPYDYWTQWDRENEPDLSWSNLAAIFAVVVAVAFSLWLIGAFQ